MKFAPGNASRAYIALGRGLYRSDDSGEKFARLSRTPLMSIAIGPDDADLLYLGPSSGGLLKSTDGGHNLQFLPQFHHAAVREYAAKIYAWIDHAVASDHRTWIDDSIATDFCAISNNRAEFS